MNEEKMLIKIEDISIFQRICNFIKRIFFRKKAKLITEEFENNTISENNEIIENEEPKIIEETEETIVEEEDNSTRILRIQEQFEKGIIKEKDLTEEEIEQLTELYENQIQEIEDDIDLYVDKIEYYRAKIEEAYEVN